MEKMNFLLPQLFNPVIEMNPKKLVGILNSNPQDYRRLYEPAARALTRFKGRWSKKGELERRFLKGAQAEVRWRRKLKNLATCLCEANAAAKFDKERLTRRFVDRMNGALMQFRLELLPEREGGYHLHLEMHKRFMIKEGRYLITGSWPEYVFFLARLAESGFRDRLRRCPGCSKFLFATHSNKKFCSRICSQREAWQKQSKDPKRKKYMKKYMRARYWQEKAQDRRWKTAVKNMK